MTGRNVGIVSLLLFVNCAAGHVVGARTHRVFCAPNLPCWPTAVQWQRFGSTLTGKLERPQFPVNSANPFYIQDQSGGTESLGWLGAWTAAPSAYAVAAETAHDIVAVVNFAREHNLRVVVKGTGHDYLGRSNAADSLLIWTHKMRQITTHDGFVPTSCTNSAGFPAVTLGAGTRWLEAYQAVTAKNGRYVQGGGCLSVGAAGGFIQGGGFGSYSKKYGTGAAGMLEAEVVTADGKVLVANRCQNRDLFWALRGGGGGTFGVVTKVTLMTHPLPTNFGLFFGNISANTDAAFKELIEHFLAFYRERLANESWGEQVHVKPNNSLDLSMSFVALNAQQADDVWQPFRTWIDQHREKFTAKIAAVVVPASKVWDYNFLQQHVPDRIVKDTRPGEPEDRFWWADNQQEVGSYWYAYQSRWIPMDRFDRAHSSSFARTLFEASRHWPLEIHFNKGQAGASAEALMRDRETSMNPALYRAAALLIAAAHGATGEGETQRSRVTAAMKIIRDATPGAGSYVNETDYFEPNWQQEFWGENYSKLLAIKRKYDPSGLFSCHHCVGSREFTPKENVTAGRVLPGRFFRGGTESR